MKAPRETSRVRVSDRTGRVGPDPACFGGKARLERRVQVALATAFAQDVGVRGELTVGQQPYT
eukprot:scaffold1056_cov564-Prasinococcus_capsulatus_cf.AAC.20